MKQVVQPIGGGPVQIIDVPAPTPDEAQVLVQTLHSIVSPGTEAVVTALAQSSLVAKARARPELVRQVLRKARYDGVGDALRAVRSRLGSDVPLGYSAAGRVIEVGSAVQGLQPGQLVATAGAGWANHAEYQAVPHLLCAPLPNAVSAEDAAFSTIASIALHGLRIADVGPGAHVVVVGLGLVGQLATRLALAAGCRVAGIDVSPDRLAPAAAAGALALVDEGEATTRHVIDWTRGRGADAVLLCAKDPTSRVIARTPDLCRDRGIVVVVGDIGLELSRTPFYERELSLRFARSYGPGRYDETYEQRGVDYPVGYVRWTEGRNLEAVLDLLAEGRLTVQDLVTHTFAIDAAGSAYELLKNKTEPVLGIRLDYASSTPRLAPVQVTTAPRGRHSVGVGVIGAGSFTAAVLLPALRRGGFERFVAVTSASGLTAQRLAQRHEIERAVAGPDAIIDDPEVGIVVVATPHAEHAQLVIRAFEAGKHVWCEKPPAITTVELDAVADAWRRSGKALMIGFNRRWSPLVETVRNHMGGAPVDIMYRVNAGAIPEGHWYGDPRQGGRIVGECCHFVDTCAAITGQTPDAVHVSSAAGGQNRDDTILTLTFGGGSLASIAYASQGHPRTRKERIDVLGGGHTAAIDDFRSIELDGRSKRSRRREKGFPEEAKAFREMVEGGGHTEMTAASLAAMRALLVGLGR